MSRYTTEVRYICEEANKLRQSKGATSVDEIIANSLNIIFDFDFPIFDESYRTILEKKILKHYYTREIGEEVVGLWKLRMNTRLNEIMPYYNQLYKSELLEFNPLYNVNTKKNGNNDRKDNRDRNVNSSSTSYDLFSDTPQGAITQLDSGNYLTNATKDTGTSTGEESINLDSTEEYLDYVTGYTGISGSELLMKYRETFLNIDVKVINELEDLFMNLW